MKYQGGARVRTWIYPTRQVITGGQLQPRPRDTHRGSNSHAVRKAHSPLVSPHDCNVRAVLSRWKVGSAPGGLATQCPAGAQRNARQREPGLAVSHLQKLKGKGLGRACTQIDDATDAAPDGQCGSGWTIRTRTQMDGAIHLAADPDPEPSISANRDQKRSVA